MQKLCGCPDNRITLNTWSFGKRQDDPKGVNTGRLGASVLRIISDIGRAASSAGRMRMCVLTPCMFRGGIAVLLKQREYEGGE